jgi:two-component system, OmpR family, sensor histidine kinase VicK
LAVSSFPSNNREGQEVTRVYYGGETVIDTVLQFLNNSNKIIFACVDQTRPSLTIDIDILKNAFLDAKKRGVKLMYITEITNDNLSYCKQLLTMVDELRHLGGIKGNFYISETGYLAPATYHEKAKPAEQIICSNLKEIIEHQRYVFDSFWNRAIPAEQRIWEIEGGIDLGKTDLIQSPQKVLDLFLDMVKSAKHEILLIIPTTNAFLREERIGVIELLKQAVERNVRVRIITPTNTVIENILQATGQQLEDKKSEVKGLEVQYSDIRYEQTAVTTVTILVVDRKESLAIEKSDDSKLDFIEAIGLSTYSNSEPTVVSYVSIFEGLSIQGELNERLKAHSLMQKEFINIAAHELRTPAQSILGYSELAIASGKLKEEEQNLLRPIYNNAQRLSKLIDDVLIVTRIESQTLKLEKEKLNMNEEIINVINDVKNQIHNPDKLQIVYLEPKESPYIEADKTRLYQVIANLLSNAIKFTKEGTISIRAEVKDSTELIVTVTDTGEGIHSDILPRLFTKFATKSDAGTGLGLFISKSIVEAHGGRMWAQNNPDGRGATFSFTLPFYSS